MKQVILEYGGAVIAILGAISFFLIFNRFFIGSEGVLGQMLSYSIGEKSLSDNKEFDVYQEKRCPQIVQKEEALIVVNQNVALLEFLEAKDTNGNALPVFISRAWEENGERISLGASEDGASICVSKAGVYRLEVYAVDNNGKKISQILNLLVNAR